MKNTLANIVSTIWFVIVIVGTILLELLTILIIVSNLHVMLKNGVSTGSVGLTICFVVGGIYGLTGVIPFLRRSYYKFPWLYPFCTMLTMDLFIVSIAEEVLSKSFSVMNPARQSAGIVLAIILVVILRVLMCVYLKFKPMVLHKYDCIE